MSKSLYEDSHLTCVAVTVTTCRSSGPGEERLLAASATRDQVPHEPRLGTPAVLPQRLAQPHMKCRSIALPRNEKGWVPLYYLPWPRPVNYVYSLLRKRVRNTACPCTVGSRVGQCR